MSEATLAVGFNSNLVRFKALLPDRNPFVVDGFNSNLVRFKVEAWQGNCHLDSRFNSNLVRFKAKTFRIDAIHIKKFQFQFGAI